jgi:hypothetical protein
MRRFVPPVSLLQDDVRRLTIQLALFRRRVVGAVPSTRAGGVIPRSGANSVSERMAELLLRKREEHAANRKWGFTWAGKRGITLVDRGGGMCMRSRPGKQHVNSRGTGRQRPGFLKERAARFFPLAKHPGCLCRSVFIRKRRSVQHPEKETTGPAWLGNGVQAVLTAVAFLFWPV